jgi:hypothetical protein
MEDCRYHVYVTGHGYGIMGLEEEDYPKFTRRLRIVTATAILVLFSMMVAPSGASFAYAQSTNPGFGSPPATGTSTQIQDLPTQVNALKSEIQTLRAQLSQLASAQSLSVFTEVGPSLKIEPGQQSQPNADCWKSGAGSQVTGGGFVVYGSGRANPNVLVIGSGPVDHGWAVQGFNSGNTTAYLAAYAQCASLTGAVNK